MSKDNFQIFKFQLISSHLEQVLTLFRLNKLQFENKDLTEKLNDIHMQNRQLEDKIKDLETMGNRGGDSSGLGGMGMESFGLEDMDMQDYFNGEGGELDEAAKKKYEDENSKRVVEFRKMMATMQTLKQGHENFKKSSQENIQNLSKKVDDLGQENLELKNSNSELKQKTQDLENSLTKEKELSKQAQIQNGKQNVSEPQLGGGESSIAGEMLEKVLKLEKEAHTYKYKSQRLNKDLMSVQKSSNDQLNLLYSIIFDLMTAKHIN